MVFCGVNVFTLSNNAYAEGSLTDIQGHWAGNVIQEWVNNGLANGYPDGTFRPENNITRAEYMALANKAFNFEDEVEINFLDVEPGDWYLSTIKKAISAGYIGGYPDGTMRPKEPITRQEAAIIIAKIKGLQTNDQAVQELTDANGIASWSKGYVGAVVEAGYMTGYTDGSFKATNQIKRGEAITAFNNAKKIAFVYDKAGTYGPEDGLEIIDRDVVLKASGVVLQNLHIKGSLTISEEVGKGEVALNNIIVDGDTFVRGGGKNSIHIDGGSFSRIIVQETSSGQVRIVAINTEGLEVVISENATGESIILEGEFESVQIEADNVEIQTQGDTVIDEMIVAPQAQGSEITLDANTKVDKMVLESGTNIKGQGTIKDVDVKADNVTYEKAPEKQTVDSSVTIQPVVTTPKSSSGGGGSGGGSRTIDVSDISISQESMMLTVGDTGSITATVSPDNATNKSITWSSSDTSIATVDSGEVRAASAGLATITATTDDGGKTAVCSVRVLPIYDTTAALGDWVKDRTEPKQWSVESDWITYSTQTEPNNNWHAWQGKKTTTTMNPTDAWKVETEIELTEDLLARDGVRTSMWLNVEDASGNNIDWSILQFKIDENDQIKGWQYWDSRDTGTWIDIEDVPATEGIHQLALHYHRGEIVLFIDGHEVVNYQLDSDLSYVKEVIFNSYSFGATYETKWKVPTVQYYEKYLPETIFISSVDQLTEAINSQADGQIWLITNGTYNHERFDDITAGGQTGWYLPITANNLTIIGESKEGTIITSDVESPNGSWSSQDHISVWGDNVTIKNLTIKPKITTNKTIEVMGKDFTLINVDFMQRDDAPYEFAGSLYFNPQNDLKDIGNVLVEDVLINDAWISCGTSVELGTLTLKNTVIDFRGSAYASLGYGVISKNDSVVEVASNSFFKVYVDNTIADLQTGVIDKMPIDGTVVLEPEIYYLNAELVIPTNITVEQGSATFVIGTIVRDETELKTALEEASEGDTIYVAAGTYELSEQLTINKAISLEGIGDATLKAVPEDVWSTVNGSKHLLAIYAGTESEPVTISNIMIDANNESHAINTYGNAYGILNDVTIKNGLGAGLTVNGSTIVANNLNTSGNSWGAVNVDPGSGVSTPSIFVLTGNGVLAEDTQIWSDGANVDETATVTVNADGYEAYQIDGDQTIIWANRLTGAVVLNSTIYGSIQAAIDVATEGDIITVNPGSYDGFKVNVNNLTIEAIGEAIITPVTQSGTVGAAGVVGILIDTATGVTVSGFTVDGDNVAQSNGVVGFGVAEVTVENMIFMDLTRGVYANSVSPDENIRVTLTALSNLYDNCEVGIGGTEYTTLTVTENIFQTTVEAIGLGVGVLADGGDIVEYLYSEAADNTFNTTNGEAVVDWRDGKVAYDNDGNEII